MRGYNIRQGKRNPFSCSRRVLSAAVLALSLNFFPANPVGGEEGARGKIAGRIVRGGEGAGGVLVEVHLEARGAGRRAPAATAVSGEDGSFLLSLPPGEYYLAAKLFSPGPGPPVVVEHPESPISITSRDIKEISFLDLSRAEEALSPSSGVRGGILFSEEPVPGASVTLYHAEVARPVGPRYFSRVESGPEGRFLAPAPPGSYLVAVRKRQRGTAFGPPQPGDLAGEYEGNPVAVGEGAFTDIGDIPLHVVDLERLGGHLGSLDRPPAGLYSVRGKVVDSEGKYVAGVFVFLYRGADMKGPPDFVTRSGETGGFVLNAPGPGKYYVIARKAYGAARRPGEDAGLVVGSPDSSVQVGKGRPAEGILLLMGEVR